MVRRYVLSVLVKNASGVLAKVVGLFSRRGYNIRSLSVGETNDPGVSRITIELVGDEHVLEQIQKQLTKLVDVVKIKGLRSTSSVYRELVLAKVKATAKNRANIIELCDIFHSKIVDVATNSVTVQLAGAPEKNAALIQLLGEFGILEISRTGITAMERGNTTILD